MRRMLCRLGLHRWQREDRVDQEAASVSGWRMHSNPPGTSV